MRTNVEFFKLADPLAQSFLFIYFVYSLDGRTNYHIAFMMLIAWQILSWIINLFIKSLKLLKNVRLIYILTTLLYIPIYLYVEKFVRESYIGVRDALGLTMFPVHDIILIVAGLIICFWYYIICFRELSAQLKKNSND